MEKSSKGPEVASTVYLYSADMADVISSLASATRLEILAKLLTGRAEFQALVETSGLSKAALAKHLRILQKAGLVRKVERGLYEITEDGEQLLHGISSIYRDSVKRQQQDLAKRARLYSRTDIRESEAMSKFVLDNQALYQPAWISYLSMATGILKSLGLEVDTVDVGGYTGYAFHLNTARSSTCPSAPTVADFPRFAEGLESFGWRVEQEWDGFDYGFPMNERGKARARAHLGLLKHTLIESNRPIGIWGPHIPEFAIMNGYDGDSYLISSFRRLEQLDDVPVKYSDFMAPGGLFKLVFKEKTKARSKREIDRSALERGLRIARGFGESEAETHKGYASGLEMFDVLADILEKGIVPESESSISSGAAVEGPLLIYHGNSYTAACNQETLALAGEFLERLAKAYKKEPFYKELHKAGEEYEKAAAIMQDFTKLFPFSTQKDYDPSEFPEDKKVKGAELLRSAKPHVLAALEGIEQALRKW